MGPSNRSCRRSLSFGRGRPLHRVENCKVITIVFFFNGLIDSLHAQLTTEINIQQSMRQNSAVRGSPKRVHPGLINDHFVDLLAKHGEILTFQFNNNVNIRMFHQAMSAETTST